MNINRLFYLFLLFSTFLIASNINEINNLDNFINTNYILSSYIILFIAIVILFFLYKHSLLKKYNLELEQRVKNEVDKNRIKDRHMLHQSRLAQMGEMTSMIAHQWRQPLNAIAATSVNIQTHLELDKFDLSIEKGKNDFIEFSNNEFNNIDLYIGTLSEILDDFRNFYKPTKKAELLEIQTPISMALRIVNSSLNENNVTLIQEHDSNIKLNIFKNEFTQVIINLIKNSQDSFIENNTKNPEITIKTKDIKDAISIEIIDNGSGIKDEIIDKIFSPYFSTKSEKNGSGLGLYMSKIIIEEHHNGKFYLKKNINGISFVMIIPV
jgi:signal transduction histidine kinase